MRLTRASDYAWHAIVWMAARKTNQATASHVIAKEMQIPERFLLKVLKPLVNRGILSSIKGPNGGYRLARSADKIHLADVIEAVDGPIRGEVPEFGTKESKTTRRLRSIFDEIATGTRTKLSRASLASFVNN